MRAIFGVVSLLVVLAIVGVLAKKQLGTVSGPAVSVPANSGVVMPVTTPGATPQQQSQQIQQQVKQSVEGVMQQPRPMPDEK